MHSPDFDVLILSETWLSGDDRLLLKNFDSVRFNRPDRRGGGVAILIRATLRYQNIYIPYNANGKIEACAVSISLNNTSVTIVSVYKPPDSVVSVGEWETFFNLFPNRNLILAGDFNSHHRQWGCNDTCTEGSKLFDAIFSSNLTWLNNGSVTHLSPRQPTGSAIDLSIVSVDLVSHSSWTVSSEPWGSDHFPIFLEIFGMPGCRPCRPRSRLYSKRTDWDEVGVSLAEGAQPCLDLIYNPSEDPLVKYSSFCAFV